MYYVGIAIITLSDFRADMRHFLKNEIPLASGSVNDRFRAVSQTPLKPSRYDIADLWTLFRMGVEIKGLM